MKDLRKLVEKSIEDNVELEEQFNNMKNGIYENKEEAIEESNRHFKEETTFIDLIVTSLGCLSIATMQNKSDKNLLLKLDYPASDYHFNSHICNIVNIILSIKDLCLNGFDLQARSLVRTLDERIYQTLILFTSPDDYNVWKNTEDSKLAHYQLFSKKKSIFKKIDALERKYLSKSHQMGANALRKEEEEYYSDAIHGSSDSVLIGALAYPFGPLDEGPFVSTLFGRASSCSFQTLHHVMSQITYFSMMLHQILLDVHNLENVKDNEFIDVYSYAFDKALLEGADLIDGDVLNKKYEQVVE